MGAIDDVQVERFGGRLAKDQRTVTLDTDGVTVAPHDHDRVSLVIINVSTSVIWLSLEQPPVAGVGIRIASGGGALLLDVEEDPLLVGTNWYGVVPSGSHDIVVIESRLQVAVRPGIPALGVTP